MVFYVCHKTLLDVRVNCFVNEVIIVFLLKIIIIVFRFCVHGHFQDVAANNIFQ